MPTRSRSMFTALTAPPLSPVSAPYATDAPVALTGMQGKVPAVDALPDFSKTGRIEVFADATERVPPASGGRFVETPLPGSVSGRDTPTACPLAGGSPAAFVVLGVETAFAARRPKVIPADSFFPFVDRYGQFHHDDWPGKIHSDTELVESGSREENWLDANAAGSVNGSYDGDNRADNTGDNPFTYILPQAGDKAKFENIKDLGNNSFETETVEIPHTLKNRSTFVTARDESMTVKSVMHFKS